MANFSGSAISKTAGKTTRAVALAAVTMTAVTAPALAGDFTQKQCLGIAGTAMEVVRAAGKDTLSLEFRQSFRTWLGADMRCDGPKEIIIVSSQDSIVYGAIRTALLAGSKPISLEKAGLRVTIRDQEKISSAQSPQRRSEVIPSQPSVN